MVLQPVVGIPPSVTPPPPESPAPASRTLLLLEALLAPDALLLFKAVLPDKLLLFEAVLPDKLLLLDEPVTLDVALLLAVDVAPDNALPLEKLVVVAVVAGTVEPTLLDKLLLPPAPPVVETETPVEAPVPAPPGPEDAVVLVAEVVPVPPHALAINSITAHAPKYVRHRVMFGSLRMSSPVAETPPQAAAAPHPTQKSTCPRWYLARGLLTTKFRVQRTCALKPVGWLSTQCVWRRRSCAPAGAGHFRFRTRRDGRTYLAPWEAGSFLAEMGGSE